MPMQWEDLNTGAPANTGGYSDIRQKIPWPAKQGPHVTVRAFAFVILTVPARILYCAGVVLN